MTSGWQEEKVGTGGAEGCLWTGGLTLTRKWGALGSRAAEGCGEGCCLWMSGGGWKVEKVVQDSPSSG